MCSGFVVSVSTQVTAGFASTYLSENCAQGLAVEIRSPGRELLTRDHPEVRAVHERPVDQDRHAPVLRQRQDALLGSIFHGGIVYVNEIGRVRPHERLHQAVTGISGDRHSDVARLAGVLPGPDVRPVQVNVS